MLEEGKEGMTVTVSSDLPAKSETLGPYREDRIYGAK